MNMFRIGTLLIQLLVLLVFTGCGENWGRFWGGYYLEGRWIVSELEAKGQPPFRNRPACCEGGEAGSVAKRGAGVLPAGPVRARPACSFLSLSRTSPPPPVCPVTSPGMSTRRTTR